MKLTLLTAAIAATVMGVPLPAISTTAADVNNNLTSSSSWMQPRQAPPVYFPPYGTEWSMKTRCVIVDSDMHFPIWRILKFCQIRHNRQNTQIYELCAQEADEEGLTEEEKFMRCARFKGFGK